MTCSLKEPTPERVKQAGSSEVGLSQHMKHTSEPFSQFDSPKIIYIRSFESVCRTFSPVPSYFANFAIIGPELIIIIVCIAAICRFRPVPSSGPQYGSGLSAGSRWNALEALGSPWKLLDPAVAARCRNWTLLQPLRRRCAWKASSWRLGTSNWCHWGQFQWSRDVWSTSCIKLPGAWESPLSIDLLWLMLLILLLGLLSFADFGMQTACGGIFRFFIADIAGLRRQGHILSGCRYLWRDVHGCPT